MGEGSFPERMQYLRSLIAASVSTSSLINIYGFSAMEIVRCENAMADENQAEADRVCVALLSDVSKRLTNCMKCSGFYFPENGSTIEKIYAIRRFYGWATEKLIDVHPIRGDSEPYIRWARIPNFGKKTLNEIKEIIHQCRHM